MSKPSILVLSPVAKYRHPLNGQSLQQMGQVANLELIECFNHSEVSRARQVVASGGYKRLMQMAEQLKAPDFVLWWDADMVCHNLDSFRRHIQAVEETGLCISGRYPMRQKQSIAASQDELSLRKPMEMNGWQLEPVLSGMGCLLMPAVVFRDQTAKSPYQRPAREGEPGQYLVCAPRIVEHERTGWAMISEDYDYCMSLERMGSGGVWFASREGRHINYAHMVEGPQALPEDYQHELVD